MKENRDMNKNDFKSFPEELQHLMKASFLNFNLTAREKAIEYLLECYNKKTVPELMFVKMLDEFMRNIMFPLEFSSTSWMIKDSEIEKLLNAQETILREQFPSKRYWNNPISENMDNDAPEKLIQRLQLYYCVLYHSSFQKKKHKKKLQELLEITKKNVTYLLTNEQSKNIYEHNEICGINNFYLIGFETFEEPLSTLYHNFDYVNYDSAEFIDIYARYLSFLKDFKCSGYEQEAVRESLEKTATQRMEALAVKKKENDLFEQEFKQTKNMKIKKEFLREGAALFLQVIVLIGFTAYAHFVYFKALPSIKNVLIEMVLYVMVSMIVWYKTKIHLSLIALRDSVAEDKLKHLFVMNPWPINYITTACITAVFFVVLFMINGEPLTLKRLLFFALESAAAIECVTVIKHFKPKPFRFLENLLIKDNDEDEHKTDCF